MTNTSILVIVLVVACLWYTGRRPLNKPTGKASPVLSIQSYGALLVFGLILAFVWS